ncbi:hypothetical protein D3C81_1870140 [compost metagenome]
MQAAVQRGPVLAAIGAAQDVAAQAIHQHFAGLADHTEEAALIRRRHGGKTLGAFIPLEQQALLARDVHTVASGSDGVEVETLGVVGTVLIRRPGLTTVVGAQDQVEHADYIAGFFVGEPDVEQRFVRALID